MFLAQFGERLIPLNDKASCSIGMLFPPICRHLPGIIASSIMILGVISSSLSFLYLIGQPGIEESCVRTSDCSFFSNGKFRVNPTIDRRTKKTMSLKTARRNTRIMLITNFIVFGAVLFGIHLLIRTFCIMK